MQILKGTGIDWSEKRLISNLYMDQSVQLKLDEEETQVRRLKMEVDKAAVCRRFISNCRANTLARKLLKGLETSE